MRYNLLFIILLFFSCNPASRQGQQAAKTNAELASEVRKETARTWEAYKKYAWGADNLLPISGGFRNWYEESLAISPIDAYSTLSIMGFESYADEIESYVIDSLDFDKDLYVKTFEVNIRILGGLLSMYDLTGDERILAKAEDFGKRMMPAFGSSTGIPHFWVNLKTGAVKGDTVNIAEGGSCLLEMGILSRFTGNPEYYEAAKKASQAIFNARSELGLVSEEINIETGEWLTRHGHIGCCIDSYYEYLFKGWILFQDNDLKQMWDSSIQAIQEFLRDETDTSLWYCRVDVHTGEFLSSRVTLYDAYFPALLAYSGHLENAAKAQQTWHGLWNLHGIEPHVYDYRNGELRDPSYKLNPEIIESAWYLLELTGEEQYRDMARTYWEDLKEYCRTDIAFSHLANVQTKEKEDGMSTFFLAETLKYLWLCFEENPGISLDSHVFSTEAHVFRKERSDIPVK